MTAQRIFMIAGPNGAGKTTMASTLIPDLLTVYDFINADEIARGLAPLRPESMALTASKLMIQRFRDLLSQNRSFAFETTAAGTNYVKYLKEARAKEYEIHLMFLWLDSPGQAIERVLQRVKQGGHHIPEETVRRRYFAGLRNLFKYYLPLVDGFLIVDNSSEGSTKVVVRKDFDNHLEIKDMLTWKKMMEIANVQAS